MQLNLHFLLQFTKSILDQRNLCQLYFNLFEEFHLFLLPYCYLNHLATNMIAIICGRIILGLLLLVNVGSVFFIEFFLVTHPLGDSAEALIIF